MVTGTGPVPGRGRSRRARRKDPAEAEFVAAYDPTGFSPVAVTVDVVVLTRRHGRLCVLLIERAEHPFRGAWALPGGFVGPEEDLLQAAVRKLEEETALVLAADGGGVGHLEQLATYGAPARDPRMRIVSVAYLALLPDLPVPEAGGATAGAHFWPVEDLDVVPGERVDGALDLAFDHNRIVADGVARARAKLEYTSLATSFVDAPFTLAELRRVYEAVWGTAVHRQNFNRKVLATPGFVVPVGGTRHGGAAGGRPAALYRAGAAVRLHPPLQRREDAAMSGPSGVWGRLHMV